jgi:hypothetical protein
MCNIVATIEVRATVDTVVVTYVDCAGEEVTLTVPLDELHRILPTFAGRIRRAVDELVPF